MLTDAGGVARRWSHDALGLVSSASDALGNVTSYSRDAEGDLASERDPDGRTVAWERDAAGRPVAVTGSGGVRDRYTWDAEGALASMEGEGKTTSFGRDALGRITSTRYPTGEVAYSWDAAGRLASREGPGGREDYAWDVRGDMVLSRFLKEGRRASPPGPTTAWAGPRWPWGARGRSAGPTTPWAPWSPARTALRRAGRPSTSGAPSCPAGATPAWAGCGPASRGSVAPEGAGRRARGPTRPPPAPSSRPTRRRPTRPTPPRRPPTPARGARRPRWSTPREAGPHPRRAGGTSRAGGRRRPGGPWRPAPATWPSSRGSQGRRTESYSELVCGTVARGQRTTYTASPHGVPDVAGMIPGPVGFAADVANTGLYIWEGDWAGAGMSAAPRVFDAIRAGRAASSSTRFASRGDDMARAATRGEGFASRTWSRAKSAFRSFRDEVGDHVRWVAGSEGGGVPNLGKKLGISEERLAAWRNERFHKWLDRGAADTSVYFGMMGEEVRYVGITRQDLDKRLAQHWLTGRRFDDLYPAYGGKLFTRHQAKALEQYNINAYGGARAHGGETLMNIIDGMGKGNRYREQALAWAEEYMRNGGA